VEHISCRGKDANYWNFIKIRFVDFIPKGSNVILDVGCATGLLGRKLREMMKVKEMIGVEISSAAAEEAAKFYNDVHVGDIESMSLPYRDYFDVVVCGDIIEHLKDPCRVLYNIRTWLKGSGILICSLPNVRYWRVLRDLVILGRWNYADAGILDNSHLRFFTRRTFIELLQEARFKVISQEIWVEGKKQRFANVITGGVFEEFLGAQFMVVATKP
jgi:O-antigen biosynthesis protein